MSVRQCTSFQRHRHPRSHAVYPRSCCVSFCRYKTYHTGDRFAWKTKLTLTLTVVAHRGTKKRILRTRRLAPYETSPHHHSRPWRMRHRKGPRLATEMHRERSAHGTDSGGGDGMRKISNALPTPKREAAPPRVEGHASTAGSRSVKNSRAVHFVISDVSLGHRVRGQS